MDDRWPGYYTRLAPFSDLFRGGHPILTYHKFGPRPRGVRLRGLYLSAPLFEAQLAELRAEGYRSASPGRGGVGGGERLISLTIDDGFRSVLEHALPVLRRHGMQATLYLVADRIGRWNDWEQAEGEVAAPLMEAGEIREWLAAGQRIGSHTLTHPWLTRISLAQAQEEIGAARRKLEDQFGIAITDFCYPYGDWNPAVRDLVQEAGYVTSTTTDFGVNPADIDLFALRRVTARHATRSWRAFRSWVRRTVGGRAKSG
jgi:peptidoglycan/xylan/chitin deacetylase (PgdA/CDA1 family)